MLKFKCYMLLLVCCWCLCCLMLFLCISNKPDLNLKMFAREICNKHEKFNKKFL